MIQEEDEDFHISTKRWICDNAYNDGDIKVENRCYITSKYIGPTHRDCNINVNSQPEKLWFSSHYVRTRKIQFKKNVKQNAWEECMRFSISNKLSVNFKFFIIYKYWKAKSKSMIKLLIVVWQH